MEHALRFLPAETIADMFCRGAFIDRDAVRAGFFAILYRYEKFGEFIANYQVFNSMAKLVTEAVSSVETRENFTANPVNDGASTSAAMGEVSSTIVCGDDASEKSKEDVSANSGDDDISDIESEEEEEEEEKEESEEEEEEEEEDNTGEVVKQVGGGEHPTGDESIEGEEEEEEADDVLRGMAVEFIGDEEVENRRFRFKRRRTRFRFNPMPRDANPMEWMHRGVEEIIDAVTGRLIPGQKVGLSVFSENHPQNVMHVPWIAVEQLNADIVLSMFEKVIQSNANFFVDGEMIVTLDHARLPRGYAYVRKKGMTSEDFIKYKKSVISVCNNDGLCLARAIVLSIAHLEREDGLEAKRKWGVIRRFKSGLQKSLAEELCRKANVDLSNGGGIGELSKFQDYFGDEFKILVFDGEEMIFQGKNSKSTRLLTLLYTEKAGRGHFNVITSVTAYKASTYYCVKCNKKYYENKRMFDCHICVGNCPACHSSGECDQSLPKRKCGECGRFFYGDECYFKHKIQQEDGRETLCARFRTCQNCFISYPTSKKHECGVGYCSICKKSMPFEHQCFIQTCAFKQRRSQEEFIFLFYDFECTQNTPLHGGKVFQHHPNLCVLQQVCTTCYSADINENNCISCGVRKHIFDNDPVKEFVDYLRSPLLQRKFKSIVCIAHNFRGYDGHFILKYVVENLGWTPSIVCNGLKILCMRFPNTGISFIDSLSYLPMPLSDLPKTFDLPKIFKKGFFPHYFNTNENKNYIGPMPEMKYYGYDSMTSEERKKFIAWYDEQIKNGVEFNLAKELREYCASDVAILTKACIAFHKTFLNENKVDPFREAFTIAGACNKVYRRNFMSKDTIAVIPRGGYRLKDKQSAIALKWLAFEENKRGIIIQHAGRMNEKKILNHKVDGYFEAADAEIKMIFQFHGCFWHGHECQKKRSLPLSKDDCDTMNTRRERTSRISEKFRELGYEVIEMWECEFHELLKNENPEILNSLDEDEVLNPREAFFGGRTNASKLYHKVNDDGEKIKYYDVCSLYPYICKYGKFPLGHPKKIYTSKDSFPGIDRFEGLIKCNVLPPEDLFHPVLPVRIRNKLMFTLCGRCAEKKCIGECNHDDNARMLTGTWVSDELRLAVSKGYKILHIFEAWEYDVEMYNVKEKNGGLFTKYINAFLRMKQESSGWPEESKEDEKSKEEYIKRYLDKEGVELNPNKIEKNPGRRALAKLMLNSFWGKFGQRENQPQTVVVKEPNEFFELLTNPTLSINSVIPVNDEMIYVNHQSLEECSEPLSTVNVVIAAYTTAQARIQLYKYLDQLGERVLYYDTDSIIFTEKVGELSPKTGEYLGDLTDELEGYGPGSYITEFVSAGPKNYAYVIACGGDRSKKVKVCKVKGITLNHSTCQIINFEQIKRMVKGEEDSVTIEYQNKISRTKLHSIISHRQKKTQRIVYDKRQRVDEFETLPFGYKRIRIE